MGEELGNQELPPEEQQGWGPDSGQPHAEVPAFPDGTFADTHPGHIEVAYDEGSQAETPETAPEATEAVHEAEVPAEEGTDHSHDVDHDENDGRWDKQKAATMAAVQQQGVGFSQSRDMDRNLREQKLLSDDPDYVSTATQQKVMTAQGQLDYKRSKLQEDGPSMSDEERAKAKAEVAEAEAALEYARTHKRETLQDESEHLGELQTKIADRELSPYVELYDSNPGRYAEMPTSEFMDIADKYEKLQRKITGVEGYKPELESALQFFEKSLERAKRPTEEDVAEAKKMIVRALQGGRQLLEQVDDEFTKTYEGEFDKTPRQLTEDQASILRKYLGQVDGRLKELQDERLSMLGQNDAATEASNEG